MMTMSERLELVKLSYERIQAAKLAMDDVAVEVIENDEPADEEEL
mgnify:CR=1 FL=1